jgi:hypothetical protein
MEYFTARLGHQMRNINLESHDKRVRALVAVIAVSTGDFIMFVISYINAMKRVGCKYPNSFSVPSRTAAKQQDVESLELFGILAYK